jgi:RimJ/RimL family protein N-acetyltransferase
MGTNIWQGHLVRLRAVEPVDAETHYIWNQDSVMARRVDHAWFPTSHARAGEWAEAAGRRTVAQDDAFEFEIETLAGEHVGSIGTHSCDRRAGTFAYGLGIREEQQRHGYASEAILLTCRYYFGELRYQKVTPSVYSFNEASIRLHERLGFTLEGRLRRMVYTAGQHFDLLYFGMTAEEFAERHADSLPSDNL